jgi:hypothetical protein
MTVCSKIQKALKYTLCTEWIELIIVKPNGTYNNHRSLKVSLTKKIGIFAPGVNRTSPRIQVYGITAALNCSVSYSLIVVTRAYIDLEAVPSSEQCVIN